MADRKRASRSKRKPAPAKSRETGAGDRRSAIAAAALEVFAKEGFERATIKKIAAQAGIKSAALIYWYFENKAELLEAALVFGLTGWEGDLSTLDPEVEPRQLLEIVARRFMQALSGDKFGRVLRIGLSQMLQRPDILERFAREGPLRIIERLEEYLSVQIERGRLRPHDPQAVARWFLFGLFGYALHHEVASSLRHSLPPPESYVSSFLDVLQWGIEPAGSGRKGKGASKGGHRG